MSAGSQEGWSNGAPPDGSSHYVRNGYAVCGLKAFYGGPVTPEPLTGKTCEDCHLIQKGETP
jgi:hypothetical protein